MTASARTQPESACEPARSISQRAGWTLHEYAEVTSTNFVAAGFEAWHAVRADTQSAGRGRFQRRWISDAGGLWLSAVLPCATHSQQWRVLPLAVGVAVCDTLRSLSVSPLRLRWPNDVLVQDRKLAGLLIDQFRPGLAVAGIGINVINHPDACDRALAGQVARLADLVSPVPAVPAIADALLQSLRQVWTEMDSGGVHSILPRVNALWQAPRHVQLDLDRAEVSGEFMGVDDSGRLTMRFDDGKKSFFEPHQVRLLRDK
jgi:BirA family transcriptional regulator, biotin operon repressor / biotin---[acetyl-CoA-carboxylase] ligase